MYKFVDTNEVSEGIVLPSEALKINGEYIENLIPGYRTLNVSGREALSPELDSYEVGIRDGAVLKSRRYPPRTITVRYQLIAKSDEAFRDAYNKLAYILDVEDAELIFDDEPDKFFTGTPAGFSDVEPGCNAVTGEFELFCADPFKYSVIEYEATTDLDDNSVLINYGGTYKAFPVLEADFYSEREDSEDGETVAALTGNGECGYVAFFTEDEKIVQIGDPEEENGEEVFAKSQTLISNVFDSTSSWGAAAKSQWTLNNGKLAENNIVQGGNMGMGVSSYTVPPVPSPTSATILQVASKQSAPKFNYTITARSSGRTANSVRVYLSITAAMDRDSNYFGRGYKLVVSVYIGGAWRDIVLKNTSDYWRGRTGHTANVSVTITGLSAGASAITGMKFKATRPDGLGQAGIVGETACENLPISQYIASVPATYYFSPSDFGSNAMWHGPSITRNIPADANGDAGATDFTLTYTQKMYANADQLGAFQALLVSGSGADRKVVAGVYIFKGGFGNQAYLRFYVNGKKVDERAVDRSYINNNLKESVSSTIKKSGQSVMFNIGGIAKTFIDSEIKSLAVTQVTFAFLQCWKNQNLAYNGLRSVKFVKDNCETWRDIPNKFSANDVVEADCNTGEIYLNGALAPDLGALGNNWEEFCLTPGLNQIGYSYSDWVEDEYAPIVKIRYREVFL